MIGSVVYRNYSVLREGKSIISVVYFTLASIYSGEDTCAIGRGTNIKKFQTFECLDFGKARTPVPREGVRFG